MIYEMQQNNQEIEDIIDSNLDAIELDFICNNNIRSNRKVLTTIEQALDLLKSARLASNSEVYFYFSVAFITHSGILDILMKLRELDALSVKGKILTTDYLYFTQPIALNCISQLNNVELKIFRCDKNTGFHTKGYIFCHNTFHEIIIGSSNLTTNALTKNFEWNTCIKTHKDSDFSREVIANFNSLWDNHDSQYYVDIQHIYEEEFLHSCATQLVKKSVKKPLNTDLKPNGIQKIFIEKLKQSISSNKKKGLLISATGTGKTFACIFGVKEANPQTLLFIVHSKIIAKQAKESFESYFPNKKVTLAAGEDKDFSGDYVFTTFQTLFAKNSYAGKERYLDIKRDRFDFVIIDECHHIGAKIFKSVGNYFTPSLFMLGMTATPDRTDDEDVYSFFGNNILLDIRLSQALDGNYLCPFKYFGISDLQIINDDISNSKVNQDSFNLLVADERVQYILKEAEIYGYPKNQIYGLVFCSTIDECKVLSNKFNNNGYRTTYLSATNTYYEREEAIRKLCLNKDDPDKLHYIFTVDIFNEGVDIKPVNQIIMLRPTQSSIIFIQQLGRGLRLDDNKEFVIVLDFIANYKTNFLIPVALSSDNSYDKEYLKRFIMQPNSLISGQCSVSLDQISRQQVLKSIDKAKLNSVAFLKERYFALAKKNNRAPMLCDFEKYNDIDPLLFVKHKRFNSLHAFQVLFDKNKYLYKNIDATGVKYIEYLSRYFIRGFRALDIRILELLADKQNNIYEHLKNDGFDIPNNTKDHIKAYCSNNFDVEAKRNKFGDLSLIIDDGDDISVHPSFAQQIDNSNFKAVVDDIISFAKINLSKKYYNPYKDTDFILYKTYSRVDITHLLNWKRNPPPLNIGGYKANIQTKTLPIFINYHKNDKDFINYDDKFIDHKTFRMHSRPNLKLSTNEIKYFTDMRTNGFKLYLFMCKERNYTNNDPKKRSEGQQYYFMGTIKDVTDTREVQKNGKRLVSMNLHLTTPVDNSIYDYIVNKD